MEPKSLQPGPVPGLLVGHDTLPTLPVIDADPSRLTPPLPASAPPSTASPSSRPPSSRLTPGRSSAGSSRVVSRALLGEGSLNGVHAHMSWLVLSALVTLSTTGLIAALAFDLWSAAGVVPELKVAHSQPASQHVAAGVAGAAAVLDPLVFHHDVEPILKAECWSCHGESGAGEFRLRSGEGGVELASVLPFVAPGRPEASLLLSKPLGRAWGGQVHASAVTWEPDDPQVRLLERWIAGSDIPSRIAEQESQ